MVRCETRGEGRPCRAVGGGRGCAGREPPYRARRAGSAGYRHRPDAAHATPPSRAPPPRAPRSAPGWRAPGARAAFRRRPCRIPPEVLGWGPPHGVRPDARAGWQMGATRPARRPTRWDGGAACRLELAKQGQTGRLRRRRACMGRPGPAQSPPAVAPPRRGGGGGGAWAGPARQGGLDSDGGRRRDRRPGAGPGFLWAGLGPDRVGLQAAGVVEEEDERHPLAPRHPLLPPLPIPAPAPPAVWRGVGLGGSGGVRGDSGGVRGDSGWWCGA